MGVKAAVVTRSYGVSEVRPQHLSNVHSMDGIICVERGVRNEAKDWSNDRVYDGSETNPTRLSGWQLRGARTSDSDSTPCDARYAQTDRSLQYPWPF